MKTISYLILQGKKYPMIEYQDGWVAFDKDVNIPQDIVAQSSNLNFEGVPKVEIETAAQSKGTFTEEQMKQCVIAFHTFSKSSQIDERDFEVWFNKFINSILPRYEVEVHKESEFYTDGELFTYQKDGCTYYKLK